MIPDSSRLPRSHYQAHSRICDLIPKSGCMYGEKQGKGELGKVLLVESMTPRPLQEKAYPSGYRSQSLAPHVRRLSDFHLPLCGPQSSGRLQDNCPTEMAKEAAWS